MFANWRRNDQAGFSSGFAGRKPVRSGLSTGKQGKKGKWDMPQQICPNCQTNNPWENRYCGNCGTALNRSAIVPSRAHLPVPAHERWRSLAQAPLVQAATVSLGALIFRSVLAWLRRRTARQQFSYWPVSSKNSPSRAIFEAVHGFFPRRSGLTRIITLAWWSIRVVGPAHYSKDELEQPEW